MNDVNLGQVAGVALIIGLVVLIMFAWYSYSTKNLTKTRAGRFLAITVIGVLASWIPLGPLSMIFGFPSVLLSAIFVTMLLDRNEQKGEG